MENKKINNMEKDKEKNEKTTKTKGEERLKNKEILDEKLFKELDNLCELKQL